MKIKVNFDMRINMNTYKDIGNPESGDVVDGISRLVKRIDETMGNINNVDIEVNVSNVSSSLILSQ